MKPTLFLLLLFFSTYLISQDFGIGMWKEHLPYNNVIKVAKLKGENERCYAATKYGVYYYDPEFESLSRMSKGNGLSDFSVSTIGINQETKTVVVGYENGNLDLIKEGVVRNLNAIKISNIIGDKTIYEMYEYNEFLYLSCGFGIVVLNTKKNEVKETYIIGTGGAQIKINSVTIFNNFIYATSDAGSFRANINTPILSDYTQWSPINLPTSGDTIKQLFSLNNYLYFITNKSGYANDSVVQMDANLNRVNAIGGDDFYSIERKENDLLISGNLQVIESDKNLTVKETFYLYDGTGKLEPNHCVWSDDNYWIGDRNAGLNKLTNNYNNQHLALSGPFTNDCFRIKTSGDQLYVATGYVDGSAWNNYYNSGVILHYNQEKWSKYNRNTLSELDSLIFDYIHVSIDPKDEEHLFGSCYIGGLVEIKGGKYINRYTYYNSSLQISMTHPGNQVKITASDVDENGNIWVANAYTSKPLTVITSTGESMSFNCGSSAVNTLIKTLYYSENLGCVFMGVRGKGLLVYDFNNTPLDASDDKFRYLNGAEGTGNLPSLEINSITEDNDGEIWIGTDKGPAILYSPSNIFQNGANYDAQQVLLLQDGSYQFLLETQSISAIAIDGANRKWIGTKSGGIFLMSKDGTEQIQAFNETNSPLLSNAIRDIAINGNTGEVYIATSKGIIGYKGTSTEGSTSYKDIYAFPNPVKESYTGPIAIRGLMENSDVKITDASGNLVFSTTAFGGQAIWDGNTLSGDRVSTGVYFVFAVSLDGLSKAYTKVLVIN